MRRFLSAAWVPFLACFLAGPLASGSFEPTARRGTTPEAGQLAEDRSGRPPTPIRIAQARVEVRVPVKRHGDATLGPLPAIGPAGPVVLPVIRGRLTTAPSADRLASPLLYYFPTGPPALP